MLIRSIPRFVVAALIAIPVAALIGIEVLIVILAGVDEHSVPVNQVRVAVFVTIYMALAYWITGTTPVRRIFSRGLWALSMALFLLPIAMIVYEVTTPPDPSDTLFPRELAVAVISFFGVVLGAVVLLPAVFVSPKGAPERSLGRLFQETVETFRRIGATRIGIALMLTVLGVLMLRVGSSAGFWSEKYTAIATSGKHTCGLRTDGTAHCWGASSVIPPLDKRFVDIAPGLARFACGLREDGSLLCWGNINAYLDRKLPADYGISISRGPFSEISAGGWHICGLRPDGIVECWGEDQSGETSPPDGARFREISAGLRNTCGIRLDGTGICWGSVDSPPGGEQFKVISNGGWDNACGIRVGGDIICWGPGASPTGLFTVEGLFAALSSGSNHACGLRPDGSVHCFGTSSAHEISDFGSDPVRGERFVSISSGDKYNCGLRQNGTVKCWGGNWLHERYR